VPGNDAYPGMLTNGCHRSSYRWENYSSRQIVSAFSSIWNRFLLNFCFTVDFSGRRTRVLLQIALDLPRYAASGILCMVTSPTAI
jgi:hypothetical protein